MTKPSADMVERVALDVTDELIDALTETIVVQTSGPIMLAKRSSIGIDYPVVLGGETQMAAARAIARNVLRRLVQLSEKRRKP